MMAGRFANRLVALPRTGSYGSSAPPGGVCHGADGGIEQAFALLQAAAEQGQDHLREQQPRPGLDKASGQRRQPPLNGRTLAAQQKRVDVPLDQSHRPGGVPGGQSVPHRVVGETMLLVPGGRGPVKARNPAGPFLLQAGAE